MAIASPLDRLQVFFGDANAGEARVYARLPADASSQDLRLEGKVVGPFCRHSRTLPAANPMRESRGHSGPLLETVVPDPCFWTPDLPMLYRVEVSCHRGGEEPEKVERSLGIRPLGTRRKQFLFDGKNWVLRGVEIPPQLGDQSEDALLRDNSLAAIIASPSDDLLEHYSKEGVLVVANVASIEDLSRLSRHACVGLAIVEEDVDGSESLRAAAPNVLLGKSIREGQAAELASWAHFVVAKGSDVAFFREQINASSVPVIACRRLDSSVDLGTARRECDQLQRDLAGLGDIAGYVMLRSHGDYP